MPWDTQRGSFTALVAVSATLALAGCGDEVEQDIPSDLGEELIAVIEDTQNSGCSERPEFIAEIEAEAERVAAEVSAETAEDLDRIVSNVRPLSEADCAEEESEEETTSTTSTEETTTEETTTDETTTEETTTEPEPEPEPKPEPEPEPEPEPGPEPKPEPEPEPDDGGIPVPDRAEGAPR